MAKKDTPLVTSKEASESILTLVNGLLEKDNPPEAIAGFRYGVAYLDIHTRLFFERNLNESARGKAFETLKANYQREIELFETLKVDQNKDYTRSYLFAMRWLIKRFEEHKNFDSALLFKELNTILKETIKNPVEETERKIGLSEAEIRCNAAIIEAVKKELDGKDPGFIFGYQSGAKYLELHALPFFETHKDAASRKKCFESLNEAVNREKNLFSEGVSKEVHKSGYVAGLTKIVDLLEKNIAFEPVSLLNKLTNLRNMLKKMKMLDNIP